MTRAALTLGVVAVLGGCDHRKPIKMRGDGGPSVEVVAGDKQSPLTTKMPLVEEKEPRSTHQGAGELQDSLVPER